MHKLFKVHELLTSILTAFPSDVKARDVLNCALVSKSWSTVALRLLWRCPYREKPWVYLKDIAQMVLKIVVEQQATTDPDYSRAKRYASYVRVLTIYTGNDILVKNSGHLLLTFMSCCTPFSHLEKVEMYRNAGAVADRPVRESMAVQLFMLALKSGPRAASLDGPGTHFSFSSALGQLWSNAGSTQELRIRFPSSAAKQSLPKTLEQGLGSLNSIRKLQLHNLPLCPKVLPLLSLPSLEEMEIVSAKLDDPDIDAMDGVEIPENGTPLLKKLTITASCYWIHFLLRLLFNDSVVEELVLKLTDVDALPDLAYPLFPPLVPRNLIVLSVHTGAFLHDDSRIWDSLRTAIANCGQLRELDTQGDSCVEGNNSEWQAAITKCPELRRLSLSPAAKFWTSTTSTSLEIVPAILSACPSLTDLSAAFPIFTRDLSMPIGFSKHGSLVTIDLGTSSPSDTPEDPDFPDWAPRAVAYLSRLTEKQCIMKLSSSLCLEEGATMNDEDPLYRAKDVKTFDDCVKAANFMKADGSGLTS